MDNGFRIFGMIFFLAFVAFFVALGWQAFLSYECYKSDNKDSAACFMVSQRIDLNVR